MLKSSICLWCYYRIGWMRVAVFIREVACCYDGVYPNRIGSNVISDAWLEVFKEKVVNR